MVSRTDRIKPSDYGVRVYLENLMKKNYQITAFQREVAWDRDEIRGLWDSVYKFFPLGNILICRTNVKLQNHRSGLGNLTFPSGPFKPE